MVVTPGERDTAVLALVRAVNYFQDTLSGRKWKEYPIIVHNEVGVNGQVVPDLFVMEYFAGQV